MSGEYRHASAALELRNLPVRPWALPAATLAELEHRLWELMPRTIVECGSGQSTRIFAHYARATGATVVSLEHDRRYFRKTSVLLGGEADHVDLRLAPLSTETAFYQTELPDGIDFALIDGPPASFGRHGTFSAIYPHLSDRFEIWLDDADRDQEQYLSTHWMLGTPGLYSSYTPLPHGVVRLTSAPIPQRPVDASGVTLSILTGDRRAFLADTLAHLPYGLIESAHKVIVFHNGGDAETAPLVADTRFELIRTDEIIPAGHALGEIAKQIDSSYWMHLEDDWRFISMDDTWLERGKAVLDEDDTVAQVRFRHLSENTMAHHQVTKQQIHWYPHEHGLVSDDAHLTNNPMLVRSHEYVPLWPCAGERAMQPVAWERGLRRVVQIHPGSFIHTGASDSLRGRTGQ